MEQGAGRGLGGPPDRLAAQDFLQVVVGEEIVIAVGLAQVERELGFAPGLAGKAAAFFLRDELTV